MLTERIQEAIRSGGMSRYAISKTTGISQDLLCHFMKGRSSLSFATADKILDVLGLEIVIRSRRNTRKEK
jgi:hypothetical protein